MVTPVLRFAPSPTGYLHIGNARPALFNALYARKTGGRLILRLDDTDRERSRPELADAIVEDLGWLGIVWDESIRQSDRTALYEAALERLKAEGRVYPAYETPDELDRKRRIQGLRGEPPLYDRAALRLSEADRARLEAEGRRPAWRFRLSGETVRWADAVRGDAHIDTASLSDPILRRADGAFLYTFASVVDDAACGVTHVIRGEDHVANTAVQIEIFEALRARPPAFAHHNLIASATGEEMSKRKGSLSLRSFREAGAEAMAVACVAVLTGTSEATRILPDLDALAAAFDLGKLSRALTKFDPAEIMRLSAQWLHGAPYDLVRRRIAELGVSETRGEALFAATRANLSTLADLAVWDRLVGDAARPEEIASEAAAAGLAGADGTGDDEARFLAEALEALPEDPFDAATWPAFTSALKARTGRSGRALFMPLRLALTGRADGPDMKGLLPLIGAGRARARFKAALQRLSLES